MPIALPLEKMSRKEKLMAMEAIWVDLAGNEKAFASPAWHAAELRKTEQLVRQGQARFADWEEAKARIRRKAAKRL